MATTNGTLTPPLSVDPAHTAPTDASAHKRKRDDDEPQPANHVAETNSTNESAQTQRDILDILKQYDTTPSFLQHEASDDSNAQPPSQKKARLDSSSKASISSKLSQAWYTSLDGLKADAARVSKDIETSLRAKAREREGINGGRLSVEELKQIQRAKAFEQLVRDVVAKENQYEAIHHVKDVKKESAGMLNGVKTEPGTTNKGTGTVLTLFGNAPTPKQLFSSMQNAPAPVLNGAVRTELPVEEMSLPNGLTATKVMLAPVDEGKKAPTFEEAFPPPYNLPTLHPPKSHKRSSTRDTTITWEFKDPIHRGNKKGGYTVQPLTDGSWLGYGGVDPSSAKEKRRQRERALSSGAESVKEPPSKAASEEEEKRYEEALFKRAYSSFAPSYDNAKAIIPAQTKANIWWQKVGEKRCEETFALDPALVSEQPIDPVEANKQNAQELPETEEEFGKIVDELLEHDEEMADAEAVNSKTNVEHVMHEISELLETLASHQRIRNATLPSSTSASRTPISPSPTLASRLGKPDEPAEDEVSTYQALRRELAYLILKLPPYAVAKLDGEQLADLGVSRLIPFEMKDRKGTLEEDQVARLAKYTAMQTAAGIATLTRGSSASAQHYNTTAQRTPAIGQAANTRYGQSTQFGSARPTPGQPQFQRSTRGQSQYGTPSATAPRPGYGQQPNQYTRPGAPQQAPSYGQTNGQQYYRPQQPAGGYGGYSQYNHQTPQQRPAYTPASSQSLQQFQQRSQSAAANAVGYQTSQAAQPIAPGHSPFANRTASPAKPAAYGAGVPPPQLQQGVQPRPAYPYAGTQQQQQPQQPGSGRATPVYPSNPQTPVNGFQQRPIAARATSGTPQPQPQPLAAAPAGQANGHA
jgi:hypothetical protein